MAERITGSTFDDEDLYLLGQLVPDLHTRLVAWTNQPALPEEQRRRCRRITEVFTEAEAAFAGERAKGNVREIVVYSGREVPASEAAAVLGVTTQRIGQLVSEGRLDGRTVNGLQVTEESIRAEAARRRSKETA